MKSLKGNLFIGRCSLPVAFKSLLEARVNLCIRSVVKTTHCTVQSISFYHYFCLSALDLFKMSKFTSQVTFSSVE